MNNCLKIIAHNVAALAGMTQWQTLARRDQADGDTQVQVSTTGTGG